MLCTSCKCRTESSFGRAEDNYSVGGLRFFLLLTLLPFVSTPLLASEKLNERVIDFHIPQQALSSALIELAEQADLTLIFPDQLVEGKRSNAIRLVLMLNSLHPLLVTRLLNQMPIAPRQR